MNPLDRLTNLPALFFFFLFFGIILYLAYIRNMETKRILKRFPDKNKILLTAFGVTFFGQESEIEKPLRVNGALVLLREGVFFRSRFGNREIFISKESIKNLGVSDFFKDKPMYQNLVAVTFLSPKGQIDRAAFRIPYPDRWILAMRTELLNK